ncbi:MAG TPA: heavy metal-associated domain-containing protein [Sulfuricurvum sp.]|nr:heavy metal-associated domain-containing protein [Sulfuricurvum sp.]
MKNILFAIIAMAAIVSADQLVNLKIDGMTCSMCIGDIKESVGKVKGVKDTTVYLKEGRAQVKAQKGTKPEAMCDEVKKLGYGCTVVK